MIYIPVIDMVGALMAQDRLKNLKLTLEQLKRIPISGCEIQSSGTTGHPKIINRSPSNIQACNKIAVEAQELSPTSSVYTVTKLSHAGGLLAQTLPALSIGARVKIETFNPYKFLDEFKNHTHTFLPPSYMRALRLTKNFKNYDFEKRWILTGSDPVDYLDLKEFIKRGAIILANWGMSEVGPIVINSKIESLQELQRYQEITPAGTFLLGDKSYIDYKIKNGVLWVKGELCVYNDWFDTGDLVMERESILFYRGRSH